MGEQPGLASCAKGANWANLYGILSCDDCVGNSRRRGSSDGSYSGLSPGLRWCLRAVILCMAAASLVLFTLSGPPFNHEARPLPSSRGSCCCPVALTQLMWLGAL